MRKGLRGKLGRDYKIMHSPLVSAILVSYNTRELTLRALEALEGACDGLNVETWVVDNGSRDDSVAQIRARPDVNIIEAGENLGFGRANNRALERARGDYFLLVNTDAFLEEMALRELLDAANRHPRAAVVAPRVLNVDGSCQRSVWPFPTPAHAWSENLGVGWLWRRLRPTLRASGSPDDEGEISWAIGACLLVRRAAYEQIGGFDPQFWMYAEETDWQKRMAEAGWQIVFAPRARVTHLGGASGAGNAQVSQSFYASQDAYTLKHHGARRVEIGARGAGVGTVAAFTVLWFARPGQAARCARARQTKAGADAGAAQFGREVVSYKGDSFRNFLGPHPSTALAPPGDHPITGEGARYGRR